MDGRPANVGAARAHGEAASSPSTSSSSLSGADADDTWRDVQLRGGFVADDGAAASTTDAATMGGKLAQLQRLCAAARAGAPRLSEACEEAASDVAAWTRQGGALRALLVVSVGSASLAALTGLLVAVFFAAVATTNAIVCSLLVSLVAAGGFLAVLLSFLASVYIGALSVAVLVIATTTAATVVVITMATGWAAFFWTVWFVATKCEGLITTKQSIRTANTVM